MNQIRPFARFLVAAVVLASLVLDQSAVSAPPAKERQTITFPAIPNMTYGAAPFAVNATASSGLPITYTSTGPVTLSGNEVTITAGGAVTITATQAGNKTYRTTSVTNSFTVYRLPQTITFVGQGSNNPSITLNATASSGLPVTYTVVSGMVTISNGVLTFTNAHYSQTAVVTASQSGNAYYAFAPSVTQNFYFSFNGGGGG